MNQPDFEAILVKALDRTEQRMVERPDLTPLVSIQKQLEYLIKFNKGQIDGCRLKDINVGLVAVREIENWDDTLAGLLHEISSEVRVLVKTDELRNA
jgi:hypothetical protein